MGDLDTGQAEAVRHALKDPAERAYRRNEELAAYPGSRVHPVLPTATYRPSRANKDSAVNNDHSTEQVLFKRSKTRQPSKRQQVGAGVGNVNDGCTLQASTRSPPAYTHSLIHCVFPNCAL